MYTPDAQLEWMFYLIHKRSSKGKFIYCRMSVRWGLQYGPPATNHSNIQQKANRTNAIYFEISGHPCMFASEYYFKAALSILFGRRASSLVRGKKIKIKICSLAVFGQKVISSCMSEEIKKNGKYF